MVTRHLPFPIFWGSVKKINRRHRVTHGGVVKQKTEEKELAAKGQKQVAGLVSQRKEKERNELNESILLVFVIPST